MYPANYLYTSEHEWLNVDGDTAVIGITDHAQKELGEIVYAELPEVEDHFEKGDEFGSLESVKAVAEVYMPIAGTVLAINGALEDNPETVNSAPHGDGWLIKIKVDNLDDLKELMHADAYAKYVAEESH